MQIYCLFFMMMFRFFFLFFILIMFPFAPTFVSASVFVSVMIFIFFGVFMRWGSWWKGGRITSTVIPTSTPTSRSAMWMFPPLTLCFLLLFFYIILLTNKNKLYINPIIHLIPWTSNTTHRFKYNTLYFYYNFKFHI